MSSDGKPHNEELENLFRKDKDSLSDFEKEALEGFAMLDGEREAFDSVEELNPRVYKALEQKKKSRVFWVPLAAAAVLIFAGSLSFYLLMGDQENLAQQINHDEVKIEAEAAKAEAVQDSIQPALDFKPSRSISTSDDANKPLPPEKEYQENATISGAGAGPGSAGSPMAHSNAKDAPREPVASPPVELGASKNSAGSAEDADLALQDSVQTGKEKNIAAEGSFTSSRPGKKSEEQLRKKSVKASNKKDLAPASAAEPDTKQLALEESKTMDLQACSYTGGTEEFKTQLRTSLQKEKIDKEFSAIIFLDANSKVLAVELSDVKQFSKKEKKKLTEVLKAMSGYTCEKEKGDGSFIINYKPK